MSFGYDITLIGKDATTFYITGTVTSATIMLYLAPHNSINLLLLVLNILYFCCEIKTFVSQ